MKVSENLILALLVAAGGCLLFSDASFAVDANFNSTLSNIRSDGTNDDMGFDPCLGGTRSSLGVCTGTAVVGLLNPTNFGLPGGDGIFGTSDDIQGLFSKLGPGATTDNMFGLVEDVTSSPGTCGAISVDALGNPIMTGNEVGTGKLNCGNIRINAALQGQDFSSFPGPNTLGNEGNGVINQVTKDMRFIDDKCASGATDCDPDGAITTLSQIEAAHVGFDLRNDFKFLFVDGTRAKTDSMQSIHQVTGVNPGAGIGTLGTPGGGDQDFLVSTDFSALSPNTASGDPINLGPDGLPGTTDDGGKIVVNWTQIIQDPDQSGMSGAQFLQSLSGKFTRDGQIDDGGVLKDQVFTCGTVDTATEIAICTSHPTGASQTTGITTATIP